MKEYSVKVSFVFEGTFLIKASNKAEAREYAEKHCGMTIERGIHSSLPDEDVNWDFPVHPAKNIKSVK